MDTGYQQGGYVPPTQYNPMGLTNQQVTSSQLSPNIALNQQHFKQQSTPTTTEIENLKYALKTSSKYVCCPYCRHQGMTRIETDCSIPNVLCCMCTAVAPWLLLQICRGKDINCYNAHHYCTNCKSCLASYHAC